MKNLTIQERIVASITYFLIILMVGYYLDSNRWDFLTNSSNHLNTLFVASALMLVMGSYVTEPYFTKPIDVIAKSFSILLVLFGIGNVGEFLFYNTFLYLNVGLLFLSIILVFIQQLNKFDRLQKIIYQVVTYIGKPDIIFSVLYILTLFSFYMKSSINQFLLLFGLWLVLIFKKPIELFSKWLINLYRLFKKETSDIIPVGQAIGCENPYLYTVEIDYDKNQGQTLLKGDLVSIVTQNDKQVVGIVINKKHLLNNAWFIIYLLSDENNELISINSNMPIDKKSIFYIPNQVFKLDIETLGVEEQDAIQKHYLYKNSSNIVGYVAKDSNINKIKFHLILDEQNEEHQNIGEGSILVSFIFGQETLYQIIDGVTTEESLEYRDKYGYTTVIAKKIGKYDKQNKELNTVRWLPSIYSPIYIQKDTEKIKHDYSSFIGTLPNTSYEIQIKEYDSLITHNTAILGILGIGKSRLTFELIQKVINKTEAKVICIDITNQYSDELKYYRIESNFKYSKHDESIKFLSDHYKDISKDRDDGGNYNLFKKFIKTSLDEYISSREKIFVINPNEFTISKQIGDKKAIPLEKDANDKVIKWGEEAPMRDLTIAEITRIISEVSLDICQNKGITEKARLLVVYEEAHSLIPEWNSAANEGDKNASNGTAKVILQGRKYGLGSFVVTQRTANISKSILNQCNTIFALRVFDDTGKQFLENYIGSDYANVLPTLEERHCIAVGKALKLKQPIILKLNDTKEVTI